MKARGGHPFGLMQIPKNANFILVKWPKNLVHSFHYILYQPKGCPPLGTTSLGHGVDSVGIPHNSVCMSNQVADLGN